MTTISDQWAQERLYREEVARYKLQEKEDEVIAKFPNPSDCIIAKREKKLGAMRKYPDTFQQAMADAGGSDIEALLVFYGHWPEYWPPELWKLKCEWKGNCNKCLDTLIGLGY